MDKKKLISSLTLAGFLAATFAPGIGSLAFAGDDPAKQEKKEEKGKEGSCAGGSCGAMKDEDKKGAEGNGIFARL